ncbi:DivIVA domain-containing protein [Streptococcus suis]|uniref:DivIVA domain-containing protein n=1 Tax=Streptococcus suis TaxID=1307 RepID=UPI000423E3EC|nr:DivIVA domain-containing protein [Streptococcus suis]AUC90917.1 cell division protein DivIVA [Streptococcus suis]MBY4975577.1 DivIVA domain-containing protein [Streptococcus suis]
MALTALELKDKTFATKFRGYDADEVDDFLDIVTRDYEDLIRKNHDQELELKNLRERLAYFDEMKESLSKSVLLAQDTAEKVKVAAEDQAVNIIKQADYDAATLLHEAKDKANEILRNATDNAKKVVIETEELKNKTRIFHQRLKSTVESQLSLVNSSEWEEILRPTASYIQTSDEAFRDVLHKALDEELPVEEESLDYTRQLTPEEIAELTRQAVAFESGESVEISIEE